MSRESSPPNLVLVPVFLVSGAVGLMYEVGWTHQFASILGGTAESMAVVFGVFLACLAVGASAFGKLGGGLRRPLRVYALLEVLIGLFGLGSCLVLLHYEGALLLWLPDSSRPLSRLAVQCGLVLMIAGPSSILMGGTLPVIMQAVRGWDMPSQRVSLLYGANTAGAAVGALLPGVVLIRSVGLSGTAIVAMVANWAVALSALLVERLGTPAAPPQREVAPTPTLETEAKSRLGHGTFLLLAALSGFQVLGLEMAWGRLGRFVLGNRALAISALLFGVLVFLGLASFALRPLLRWTSTRWRLDPDQFLAGTLLVAAVSSSLLGAPAAALAEQAPVSLFWATAAFTCQLAVPFFLAGLVFPWLLTHSATIDVHTSRSVGTLYAANVAGSLVGSLGTTLVLLELLGTMTTLFVLSTCSAAAGIAVSLRAFGRQRALRLAGGAVSLWVAGACLYPWALRPHVEQGVVVRAKEDRYGLFVLLRHRDGMLQAINNSVPLVARLGDANTTYAQHLQADLAMLLARDTRRICNVGTGYGITAGAFSLWGTPGRYLETIEILPEMAKSQADFEAFNYGYFRRPEIKLITGDGRHHLLAATEPYDIISVNPLDPRLPGSSSLCTVEFWQAAKSKLRPGGVYTQLVWGGQKKILLQGFAQVFGSYRVYRAYQSSLLLVGFAAHEPWPSFHFERLTPEVREIYRKLGISDVELFVDTLQEVAESDTERWTTQIRQNPMPRLHTTNRPILEYETLSGSNPFRVADEVWR